MEPSAKATSEVCATRDLLPGFAAGELSADDDARVREHLSSCAPCRDALASFAGLDEAETAVAPPEQNLKMSAARVQTVIEPPGLNRRRSVGSIPARRVVFGFAGAFAVVLVAVMFRPPSDGSRTDTPLELAQATDAEASPVLRSADVEEVSGAATPVQDGRSTEVDLAGAADAQEGRVGSPNEAESADSPHATSGPEPLVKSDASPKPSEPATADKTGSAADSTGGGHAAMLAESIEAEADSTALDEATLLELAALYAQIVRTATPLSALGAPRGKKGLRTTRFNPAMESLRRQQNEALDRARAREIFVFAMDRKSEGDVESAIGALVVLLRSEDAEVRQKAWKEVIGMEAERVLTGGDPAATLRVALTADAFLREYPRSRYRNDLLGPRVRLWAEAIGADNEQHCVRALAAAAQWEVSIDGGTDPLGAEAAQKVREHCLR